MDKLRVATAEDDKATTGVFSCDFIVLCSAWYNNNRTEGSSRGSFPRRMAATAIYKIEAMRFEQREGWRIKPAGTRTIVEVIVYHIAVALQALEALWAMRVVATGEGGKKMPCRLGIVVIDPEKHLT